MQKKILYLWDADYPWDIRVSKVTRALSKKGFGVSVVCRNLKRLPTFEVIDDVKFYRLLTFKNKSINYFLSFPLFFNFLWLNKLYSVTKKENPQAIIVRDLPLAITAIIIGKVFKLPIIIDMAENYPAMIKDMSDYGKFKWTNFIIRNAYFAKLVERISIRRIDRFIVVTEENKRRLVQNRVPASNIYIACNTPDLEECKAFNGSISEDEKSFFKGQFTIIYVGGLGPIRGLEMVVEAMTEIIKQIPHVHLLIIGKGEKRALLEYSAKQNNVSDHVTFKGWINFKLVPQYINCAKVGIVPHRLTEHTNTTIPNKIFDYMAFGLPVIASNTEPMERIIRKTKGGIIFEAGNKDDFVRAVLQVYKDTENKLGQAGKKAVEEEYNWENDSNVILKMINDLCGG